MTVSHSKRVNDRCFRLQERSEYLFLECEVLRLRARAELQ